MVCPAIITGDRFLERTLAHIDCQAQHLGSFGYQSLGTPGSLASTAMTGLLTLFVALFGIRLLFGPGPQMRDVVYEVLRIGIVLTLAFSWPAYRTVIYDLVLQGPAEVSAAITSPDLPDTAHGFAARLQGADNAMVRLTEAGTGRTTGAFVDAQAPGGTFRASVLQDEATLGWARLAWLASVIGSLALLRLISGLLLALAPLAAGLLLFGVSRGIFAGWLRGLVLAMTGTIGATIVLAAELAMLEPWLADALRLRTLGYATPSAPIELLALTVAFAFVQFGMICLLAKVAFTRGWPDLSPHLPEFGTVANAARVPAIAEAAIPMTGTRAERIADSVETRMRREEWSGERQPGFRAVNRAGEADASSTAAGVVAVSPSPDRLGSSWRRTSHRSSMAAGRRNTRR